jgi:hypothetical protein
VLKNMRSQRSGKIRLLSLRKYHPQRDPLAKHLRPFKWLNRPIPEMPQWYPRRLQQSEPPAQQGKHPLHLNHQLQSQPL